MSEPLPPEKGQKSLSLLADAPELLRLRVLPAEFARLLGVSKQAVSRWIADGKVTINPIDGRLDVHQAVRQVLRHTDPGRVRSRVLRAAIDDVVALRRAVVEADERAAAIEAELGAQLAEAREQAKRMERYARDADCMLDHLIELLIENESALRATPDSAAWAEAIQRIEGDAAEACGDADVDALAADALAALTAREAQTSGEAGRATGDVVLHSTEGAEDD